MLCSPTKYSSLSLRKYKAEGDVLSPILFGIIFTEFPSHTPMQEFVVPKSIPVGISSNESNIFIKLFLFI